ncbi:MAG: cupin domain-containing protein [Burkholderiales bacterium]|nr:cupin domain-containing protein [Burkholderiales bacterium]
MNRFLIGAAVVLASALCFAQSTPPAALPALAIKPLAEKKIAELPAGPLYWRVENYPALEQAQAAAGPTGLAVQAAGKAWLLTLGPKGGATAGATPVAEIGPIPNVVATQYLLRINEASGRPGSVTPVHTHPGSETFFVLTGETSSRSPKGVLRVAAGQARTGLGADVPMQVSSSGATDLHSLVMFVVDANRPFSSPAQLP